VRSVSLTLDRIVEAETQMELWDVTASRDSYPHSSRPRALQHALDRISTRYGARAVTTGAVRALTR
jgi:hypothetical protein